MTLVRTIRCLRASLLAIFVVAQVMGVIPLLHDHTLNVYEAAPVAAHNPPPTSIRRSPILMRIIITERWVCMISAVLCIR